MGQKVNPHGLRVGIIKDWDSRWYAEDHMFGDNLVEETECVPPEGYKKWQILFLFSEFL